MVQCKTTCTVYVNGHMGEQKWGGRCFVERNCVGRAGRHQLEAVGYLGWAWGLSGVLVVVGFGVWWRIPRSSKGAE